MNIDLSAMRDWASKETKTSIRIVNHRKIKGKTSSFLDVSAHCSRPLNPVEFAENFRSLCGGRAIVMPGTFRDISSSHSGVFYRFVAKQTRPSKPFIETANMQFLGNDQYLDTAKSLIWEKIGEGDNARIVMAENDDLESLLDNYKSRIGTNAEVTASKYATRRGDYASFISNDGSLSYGFIMDTENEGKVHVASLDTKRVESVTVDNIVGTVNPASTGAKRAAKDIANYDVAMSLKEAKPILDYLSMLYPPEYINAYKRALGL